MTDDEAKAIKDQNEAFRTELSTANARIQELELAAQKAAEGHAAELAAQAKRHAAQVGELAKAATVLEKELKANEHELARYRDGAIAQCLRAVEAALAAIKQG